MGHAGIDGARLYAARAELAKAGGAVGLVAALGLQATRRELLVAFRQLAGRDGPTHESDEEASGRPGSQHGSDGGRGPRE